MNADTYELSALLLPELIAELSKTRRVLERVLEEHSDFKPHEKSKTLLELSNHLATVSGLAGTILASPGAELGGPADPRRIVKEATTAAILPQFDELVAKGIQQLKQTSDKSLAETWEAKQGGRTLFSGSRYMAYRTIAVNHMIHHRAQLTGYLRQLDLPVPAIFGPSADETPA